jgi:hypothetical protein
VFHWRHPRTLGDDHADKSSQHESGLGHHLRPERNRRSRSDFGAGHHPCCRSPLPSLLVANRLPVPGRGPLPASADLPSPGSERAGIPSLSQPVGCAVGLALAGLALAIALGGVG